MREEITVFFLRERTVQGNVCSGKQELLSIEICGDVCPNQ